MQRDSACVSCACKNLNVRMCASTRLRVVQVTMSDIPAPADDANFIPLSQSHYIWRPGQALTDTSPMEGSGQSDIVARLAAQHVRFDTFLPRTRSRSPPSMEARGCAQPVVSSSLGRASAAPQLLGNPGQPVRQPPRVPVFSKHPPMHPVGQFDPALRGATMPLQTPPRRCEANVLVHPRNVNGLVSEATRRMPSAACPADPDSSEKISAAAGWVAHVAAAWNLQQDAPLKQEPPVVAQVRPSPSLRAPQMQTAAHGMKVCVGKHDDDSDEDAALLAACVSLEKKI